MKFLQKYWFLILILIIAIIILYKQLSKPKTISSNLNTNTNQNILNSGVAGITNVLQTFIPPTIKTNNFVYGDKIYANENSVNTYKGPSATPSNLDSYTQYNKDNFIGTFVQKDGIFSELLITNPAHHVWVLSSQVFSK